MPRSSGITAQITPERAPSSSGIRTLHLRAVRGRPAATRRGGSRVERDGLRRFRGNAAGGTPAEVDAPQGSSPGGLSDSARSHPEQASGLGGINEIQRWRGRRARALEISENLSKKIAPLGRGQRLQQDGCVRSSIIGVLPSRLASRPLPRQVRVGFSARTTPRIRSPGRTANATGLSPHSAESIEGSESAEGSCAGRFLATDEIGCPTGIPLTGNC